jgi:hypothetical protein
MEMTLDSIINKYQGGNEMLSDEEQDFLDKHNLFDELENCIFHCVSCFWWAEAHEMCYNEYGEQICTDCKEEE